MMPNVTNELSIIPILLKRGIVQKFKLPFKGQMKHFNEIDVDFSFMKTSA